MGSHLSAEYVLKLDPEKMREMPMVDLAFEVLKAANTPFYYRDLMNEVAKLRGFTEEQINEVIAQLYTEINIDGRFACVGNNVWGLKRWYPVERDAESVAGGKGLRIINDDDDDDEDLYAEDEEGTFASDEESFDLFDEDREEIFGEGEDAVDVDDDVVLDDDDDPVLDDEDLEVGGDDEELADDLDDTDADDFDFDDDEDDR
jgi:DNA-directed RNA polymerase subunit delta